MAASAETYRPLQAPLRKRAFRFVPLLVAGIRTATKRKLPLILLYGLPMAWGIVFSFNVYSRYALESGVQDGVPTTFGQRMMLNLALQRLQVSDLLDTFFKISRLFAILPMAWYGAGLLADDRRLGAHLLLFSRPLTRLDYVLGRFLTVVFFGLLATLVPGLMICTTAAFSSPDWSFLREDFDVVLGTIGFAFTITIVIGLIVLAVSSLAPRKIFALVGVFGVIIIPHALSHVLAMLQNEETYRMLSPLTSLRRAGAWFLGREWISFDWPAEGSFLVLAGVVAASVAILAWRIRRWEVVQ